MIDKNNTPPATNDLNGNNKKKAFKEGEMDNTIKLDNDSDEKETDSRGSLPDIDDE